MATLSVPLRDVVRKTPFWLSGSATHSSILSLLLPEASTLSGTTSTTAGRFIEVANRRDKYSVKFCPQRSDAHVFLETKEGAVAHPDVAEYGYAAEAEVEGLACVGGGDAAEGDNLVVDDAVAVGL